MAGPLLLVENWDAERNVLEFEPHVDAGGASPKGVARDWSGHDGVPLLRRWCSIEGAGVRIAVAF